MKAPHAGEKKRGESICGVLKHPMRVRILEILNEGPKSPSQFVEEGLVPKQHYENYHQALSLAPTTSANSGRPVSSKSSK